MHCICSMTDRLLSIGTRNGLFNIWPSNIFLVNMSISSSAIRFHTEACLNSSGRNQYKNFTYYLYLTKIRPTVNCQILIFLDYRLHVEYVFDYIIYLVIFHDFGLCVPYFLTLLLKQIWWFSIFIILCRNYHKFKQSFRL